MFQQDENVSIA